MSLAKPCKTCGALVADQALHDTWHTARTDATSDHPTDALVAAQAARMADPIDPLPDLADPQVALSAIDTAREAIGRPRRKDTAA